MGVKEVVFALVLLLCWYSVFIVADLQMGLYRNSCPQAETIVREEVNQALRSDVGIAAGLLRMHFHDCFVRGCDGSVLIDSTPANTAEKDSVANNPSLRGFEVIDKVKARLEASCKGVVSCADILAFAARDSIALTGGFSYPVLAGRRDGRVSTAAESLANLPGPSANLNQLTRMFANKGFSQDEMVTLSGAHTIGRAHCNTFSNRLYNFSATNNQDPDLDSTVAMQLKQQCPQGNSDASTTVLMDRTTPNTVDSNYYSLVLANRALFESDQALKDEPATATQVIRNALDNYTWRNQFSHAMFKLSQLGVLTGTDGEIRLNCRVIN